MVDGAGKKMKEIMNKNNFDDPVITPFVHYYLAFGWKLKIRNKAAVLHRCPRCKEPYYFTFFKGDVEIKKCPWCDSIDDVSKPCTMKKHK